MKNILFCAIVMLVAVCSCNGGASETEPASAAATDEPTDSMVYGLTCDGTNDSVIVFLPFRKGADPITYNIEIANAQGRVIGQPKIGDWVSIIVNPSDTTEASLVVDLDQLKGTWTYSVRPTWKDASKLSRRALARKLNDIPDSLREAYLVPREYGFTLQRSYVAKAVGRVHRESTLEDDSPVEYPKVKNYTAWKVRNGRLILTSTDSFRIPGQQKTDEAAQKAKPDQKEKHDTLQLLAMNDDSLVVLTTQNKQMTFYRQANAISANAEAQKAVQKVQKVVK